MSSNEHAAKTGFRIAVAASLALVGTAAATAFWLHYVRQRERRRKTRLGGISLADEIREALEREEAEADGCDDDVGADFTSAKAWVSSSGQSLPNDAKLALYGCYKQATEGDAPVVRPFGGMATYYKWDAWRAHSGESKSQAMCTYVQTLGVVAPNWRKGVDGASRKSARPGPSGTFGPSVSIMAKTDLETDGDVDETAVGKLCKHIAEGESDEALALLRSRPGLAFEADKDRMTPLHWAADRGEEEVVKALIKINSDKRVGPSRHSLLNAVDQNGDTALHFAVNTDNEEVARLLISAGANPEIANADGETAMALAAELGWVATLPGTLP